MSNTAKSLLIASVFLLTVAGVWFVTSGSPLAALTNSTDTQNYLAPSGTTYPAPYSPENFRSRMYTWEKDVMDWDAMSPEYQREATKDRVWEEKAAFTGLSTSPAELAELWLPSVHDPHDLLSQSEQRIVLSLLAEHAIVRSASTPAKFRALVDADPTLQWRDDLSSNFQFKIFYDFFLEEQLDFSMPPLRMLDEVWEGLREHEHLYSQVGYGPNGAIFPIRRIRSAELLRSKGLRGTSAPKDADYWYTIGARAPMQFTEPIGSVESTLQQHDSVVVIFALIVVRLEDGRLGVWDPVFYRDPESGRWILDSMGSWNVNTFMTIM